MVYEKQHKLHIVAVTAVVRNEEGKYLVLKRSEREIAHPGKWTLPGGKMENNDSVEETLRDELEEEAGLKMKPGKVLLKDASFTRPDGQTVKVFVYLCEVEDTSKVKIPPDFTEYRWVALGELKKLSHVAIEDEIIQAEKVLNSGANLAIFQTESPRYD